ncbi:MULTISPECIES: glycosyltransferase family 9 protein [Bordetella]|uniref:Glycosyl transferase n=1 Tax=Bordetella genomosp. 6 TaxID=463024 RepID=A0ABX4FP06_9BORD|nr:MULTISPECIES: glycosyltransferase family 9 protein [Bordetella]AOB26811.1 glycosyl transferase [Bordetella bronchiseptica]AZW44123.1 glycosyltransferase family 9 protein [Bordetella bronchiseptica]KCV61048.1 heptosyltransferase [Bordetella bronchiseptica 99-R-0433]MBN3269542.1 glycosyltransferase family 9 protein [Bordetella bronchiseptica]OZI82007.1 glycosyl transferase [Bordetella genomosp. 6]
MNRAQPWRQARRILCVRLDNLGDVLMTTPALRALRDSGPPARTLTLLGSPAGAALAPHIDEIDEVVEHRAAWVRNARADDTAELAARLRAARHDAAVIFTVYTQSPLPAAMLCRLAGIPLVLAHCRENPYALLSDWVPDADARAVSPDAVRHEVRRQLDLVAAVGAHTRDERLSFRVREADRASLFRRLHALGVTEEGGWIAVHAGASAASRRYPAELLAQALVALRGSGRRLLMLGGEASPGVRQALAATPAAVPGMAWLDDLSLGELAAAIERAGVLICNNSGPAHLGAALGVPVADLYALTNPQHAPWLTPHKLLYQDVPCRYCLRSVCPQGHHACLAGVPPARVARAAQDLLAGAN